MSSFEASLSKTEYKTWLKTGLCLSYLKDGLCAFVNRESEDLHKTVLYNVRESMLGPDVQGPIPQCNYKYCMAIGIHWASRERKWKLRSIDPETDWDIYYCPNYICNHYLDVIQQEHISGDPRGMCWENSNIRDWPSSHWEVSKVLMDRQEDGARKTRPDEFDCSALIKFIENAKICHLSGKVSLELARKVREDRNKLVHSAMMELSHTEMMEITQHMISLLQSLHIYDSCPEAQRAVENIQKAREKDIDISLSEEINYLKETERLVKKLETTQKEMKQKLEEYKLSEEDLKRKVETYKMSEEEMKQELENMKASEEALKQQLRDIKESEEDRLEHIQRIEEKLEYLQSPRKQHDEKAKELKSKLIELYHENCSQIPVSPIYTKTKYPIKRLYTDLVLTVDKQQGVMKRRNQSENERTTELPVKTYRDIFFGESQRLKSIFIIGEAGTGKTTFASKIAADWVSAHTGDSCNETRTADIETMKEFNFLFLVTLRSTSCRTSVFEAICESLEKYSSLKPTITYLFENVSEQILVICDGLDEIKEIPGHQKLHDCTLLTMSRPWKFELIESHVDSVLTLKGLNDEGIDDLSEKVLEVVYEDSSLHTKQALKRALGNEQPQKALKQALAEERSKFNVQITQGSPDLQDLSKMPLLLVYLIHVWVEDGHYLPTSFTDILKRLVMISMKFGRNRLVGMTDLNTLQKLWRKNTYKHNTFVESKIFRDYAGLLQCLAHLAFDTLTNSKSDHSLVFTDEDTEKYFESEFIRVEGIDPCFQLEACVRLGLLVKSDYPSFTETKYTLSFQHKVVHEFFSALRIVESDGAMSQFAQYCSSGRALLEMSNVFRFVCGLSPEVGTRLSEHFAGTLGNDSDVRLCRNESELSPVSSNICERLTLVFCDCVHECYAKDQSKIIAALDVSVRPGLHEDPTKLESITRLICFNRRKLRSLTIDPDVLQHIETTSLSELVSLEKFSVNNIVKDVHRINIVLSASTMLEVLTIEGYFTSNLEGLSIPPLERLRHLKLNHIATTTSFLAQLQTIVSFGKLESLKLYDISLEGCSMDFAPLANLRWLDLLEVKMCSSVWNGLLSSLGSFLLLQTLCLRVEVSGEVETVVSATVDLKACSKLTFIDIRHSGDFEISHTGLSCMTHKLPDTRYIIPLLSSLSETSLAHLTLWYLDRDSTCCLLTILPQLRNVEQLILKFLDIDGELSLSGNVKLVELGLEGILLRKGCLDLTQNAYLNNVSLDHVIFGRRYVKSESTESTKLEGSTVYENESQLLLPSNTGLVSLSLSRLKVSVDTWKYLFSMVENMNQLSCLQFQCVNAKHDQVKIPDHMYTVSSSFKKDSSIAEMFIRSQLH